MKTHNRKVYKGTITLYIMKNTMLEEYTTNEIQKEIQLETNEDISNILAGQRVKENPLRFNND